MSDKSSKIINELIQLTKTKQLTNIDIANIIKKNDNKPIILYPFGFYTNITPYLIPHPDYPDNLDMY